MRDGQHNLGEPGAGPSDQELVDAARKGDRGAYATLVNRHLRSVYSVALRVLGQPAEAEDVSQDTFLRAFERLDLFDDSRSFRNWLLKIASNLAINRIRSRGRERRLQLKLVECDERGGGGEADDVPGPSEWAHWLAQIDDMQRAAIVLFHFHEMPYTEIAEVLQVPVNTVRTYLYRGRKRLRELMTGESVSENGAWTAAM
ncbi:MAG TPA: RNA polymerase sigma factor [Phycisphaerae bacterium]|nr:RNA polymerase sigma factor [Phycisphaerae bacterium]HON68278.1 RNA polymerase sigma factor [Phycisphaerae bacterium]HPZ99833.1 RNA polymerase sigma factor [Phycisphaerae bacterium]HQE29396.1 RNA polymerase sigma factor [Phycisphaerae bacterium]